MYCLKVRVEDDGGSAAGLGGQVLLVLSTLIFCLL